MNYYGEYIKYKVGYLELKRNDMIGGNKKNKKTNKKVTNHKKKSCDDYTFIDLVQNRVTLKTWNNCQIKRGEEREKELENVKSTNSYISGKDLSKDMVYYIHDNGGRPFKAIATQNKISLNRLSQEELDKPLEIKDGKVVIDCDCNQDKSTWEYTHIIDLIHFEGYWEGFDSSADKMHGNSILIKINDHKYVFVGWEIYSFETNDVIIEYISPVGNNDVPYPIAIGNEYIYLMTFNKMIKRSDLKEQITLSNSLNYSWELGVDTMNKNKKSIYKSFDIKNRKIIHERL